MQPLEHGSTGSNTKALAKTGAGASALLSRASSVTRALDQIGDKWSLLIIQEVFWGINTFSGMLAATGVSRGVLSDRLKWLQAIGCLRQKTTGTGRHKNSYHLTRKSLGLHASAMMAIDWERRHYRTPALDNVQLVHAQCGSVFSPAMRCASCHAPVHGQDVSYSRGPGDCVDRRPKKVRRRSSISSIDVPSEHSVYRNLINIVGDRWTANVIVLAFHGQARFEQFLRRLPVATNILSDRLRFLEAQGVLASRAYQHRPRRVEYFLTPKGWDLFPYFLALLHWGDQWCDEQGLGPPMLLTHTNCAKALKGEVVCDQCHGKLEPFGVSISLN